MELEFSMVCPNCRSCSMCYGDPHHGTDGYYQALLDEHARQAEMERHAEQAMSEVPGG